MVIRDGRFVGHNTDVSGFAAGFRAVLPGAAKDRVVQVGTGGAGSAVASALLSAGVQTLHLFDVDLPSGESWRESNVYSPGKGVVLVNGTPVGKLGLTICYDLRFPGLFARLAESDADVIAVPAAFTVPTGKAHWHVLLRARAIEAGLFVVAAAQVGHHEDARIDAGEAKRYTFFDVADRKPPGAVVDEHTRYFDGSVPVSVRLHDGHDRDRFTNRLGYRAVVVCDL